MSTVHSILLQPAPDYRLPLLDTCGLGGRPPLLARVPPPDGPWHSCLDFLCDPRNLRSVLALALSWHGEVQHAAMDRLDHAYAVAGGLDGVPGRTRSSNQTPQEPGGHYLPEALWRSWEHAWLAVDDGLGTAIVLLDDDSEVTFEREQS